MSNGKRRSVVKPVIAGAVILSAVTAASFGFKEYMRNNFVFEWNSVAKAVFNGLNSNLLMSAEEGKTPLPAGDYLAYCKVDGDTVTITPDDSSFDSAVLSASDIYMSQCFAEQGNKLYFSFRMENGSATDVRACKRNILRKASETKPPEQAQNVSWTDFYLKRFVAYYP